MSSRAGIVSAILVKDVRAFARDRFYVLMSLLGLVAYVLIFWLLPSKVNDTLDLGVHQAGLNEFFSQVQQSNEQGLAIVPFDSADALRSAVESGNPVTVGVDFPTEFLADVAAGRPSTVTVFLGADVPESVQTVVSGMVREMAYAAAGEAPPVALPAQETVVLGVDRAGDQVSLQEKFRPLLAFFILLIETMALGALVASEIQNKTASAILVTPARVSDLLIAKAILGTLLAFVEVALLMAAIDSFATNAGSTLVFLVLGAVLVTGFGLLAGSTGADFIGIVFWGMAFMIPMAVPAVGLLFPGSMEWWMKLLPSWGLAEGLLRVDAYGDGVGRLLPELGALLAWCVAALAAGWLMLKRRVVTL